MAKTALKTYRVMLDREDKPTFDFKAEACILEHNVLQITREVRGVTETIAEFRGECVLGWLVVDQEAPKS